MELRIYQLDALDQIRALFGKKEKKVLLHMATGGGKTVIFSEVLKGADKKGKKCLVAVRGRKLVDQASKRLLRENVDHGVYMANHKLFRPHKRIQVCSIDTLRARRKRFKDVDLIVIDEADEATSKSYYDFIEAHPDSFILGVTATPYTKDSLRHIADHIVYPVSIQELMNQGFLVGPRYFGPSVPDLSDVKMDYKTGDYNQKQLSHTMMEDAKLMGDIVQHWQELGENRATLCFAVSIEHSKLIVSNFNDAGIPAMHCDAGSSDDERLSAIQKLESGEIKILSNVGLFNRGVDIPFLSCLILARPTMSYRLYIQQMGRGTRICPEIGKENFIVLDHAGNVSRHGFIEDEQEGTIDGKYIDVSPKVKTCSECFAIIKTYPCDWCGAKPAVVSAGRDYSTDETVRLSEINKNSNLPRFTAADVMADIKKFDIQKERYGFKKGWVYHQIKNIYGKDVASRFLGYRFREGR